MRESLTQTGRRPKRMRATGGRDTLAPGRARYPDDLWSSAVLVGPARGLL